MPKLLIWFVNSYLPVWLLELTSSMGSGGAR